MRLQTLFALMTFSLILPPALLAQDDQDPRSAKLKQHNEATIDKLDGTIMVKHGKDAIPTALQTGSILEKGDTLMVYDQSWVILKTHCGDRIGLDSNTVMTIDEYFIEGPDRQIRFLLQKGTLFLKTNNRDSRQSFFEINAGSVVVSIGDTQSMLTYTPEKSRLRVQYMEGKLSVIDKNAEHKLGVMPKQGQDDSDYTPEHTEHNWDSGTIVEKDPIPMEEIDVINYRKFLDGEKRLPPPDRNLLLRGNE